MVYLPAQIYGDHWHWSNSQLLLTGCSLTNQLVLPSDEGRDNQVQVLILFIIPVTLFSPMQVEVRDEQTTLCQTLLTVLYRVRKSLFIRLTVIFSS